MTWKAAQIQPPPLFLPDAKILPCKEQPLGRHLRVGDALEDKIT